MESRYAALSRVLDMPRPIIDLIDMVAGPRVQIAYGVPSGIKVFLSEYRRTLPSGLTDAKWKQKCIDKYGRYMFDVDSKGDFKSWKRYYAYFEVMFTARSKRVPSQSDGIPEGMVPGDVTSVAGPGIRSARRRYMYDGSELVDIMKYLPKPLHILSKVPLHYFADSPMGEKVPFNAYDIGLYLDWDDVETIGDKFCVTFYHQNIGYCIGFDKQKYVTLFNFTVYLMPYIESIKEYTHLVKYVQKEYRVNPGCVFLLDFGATAKLLSDE